MLLPAAVARIRSGLLVGDAYLAIAGGDVSSGNGADAAIPFARAAIAGLPADAHGL